ncbi:DUF4113 domain-containing protein [Pseudomonas sp. 5P_3.1_Bac2]|nr:DUF4113 domain-containing protein [Pseudomonas sp. 5P_3.1_Bac2]MCU1719541.1 DUF4113 domain-containing protein [Pseudomonas sp. 5P_3.1_Bac2]
MGLGALRPGGALAAPEWAMRRELLSACYTAKLDQL